jgi:hypothetical protein
VRSLAKYIEQASRGSTGCDDVLGEVVEHEVTGACCQLRNWMASQPPLDMTPVRPSVQNVFLTGATGFLGLGILRELLTQPEFLVIALVRAPNASEGFQRITQTARDAKWWNDRYSSRLTVLVGDLSQPKLGLSKIHWQQVTSHCHPDHAVHIII